MGLSPITKHSTGVPHHPFSELHAGLRHPVNAVVIVTKNAGLSRLSRLMPLLSRFGDPWF
jgi:hypothetical protein